VRGVYVGDVWYSLTCVYASSLTRGLEPYLCLLCGVALCLVWRTTFLQHTRTHPCMPYPAVHHLC
jgi:hypothetical protein